MVSDSDVANTIGEAIARATAAVERLASNVMPPPTDDEVQRWSGDPDTWPHTPPLAVWRVLDNQDRNLRWHTQVGHIHNLLDAAIEKLEDLGVLPDMPIPDEETK